MAGGRTRARGKMELISVEAEGRVDPGEPPESPEALLAWLEAELDLRPADRALIAGNSSPLDYLVHAFFEGRYVRADDGVAWRRLEDGEARTADCVVWAARGGGKTFLGALATLLDLLFKESVQVRVLAGSLEQAGRMHGYLRTLMERPRIAPWVRGRVTTRAVRMASGGCAQVLAASQTSVRGTRVQKLRCDEVELFPRGLWEAAQLVTRSLAPSPGPWGDHVRGSVEALSTMHVSHGLMWDLVRESAGSGDGARRPVFRWGVVDALERCERERACGVCPLWGECGGRAKDAGRRAGHVRIDDAITLKRRVDRAAWESEMLCLRPRERHAVYPEFDPSAHVPGDRDPRLGGRRIVGWYAGMDFGIRAESVVLLASLDDAGVLVVEREHAAAGQTVIAQRDVLRGWIDAGLAGGAEGSAGGAGGLVWVSIDPAGFARSEQTGERNAGLLKEAGWRIVAARGLVHAGIRAVRRRLAPADGERGPTLLVHERCTRLVECLRRYRYAPDRPESLVPEKGEFDHACDALRYLVSALDGGEGVRVARY